MAECDPAHGQLLAVAVDTGLIEIYDIQNLELKKVVNLQTDPIYPVLFPGNVELLCSTSQDGTLRFLVCIPN